MDNTAAELMGLYRRSDPGFKEIIFRMITLAGKYGTPFLQETEGPAHAGDLDGLRAIFKKWEAK